MFEWSEKICDDFYKEKSSEEITYLDDIKGRFYTNLHNSFLYIVQILLDKFLIDKVVRNLVEERSPFRRNNKKSRNNFK